MLWDVKIPFWLALILLVTPGLPGVAQRLTWSPQRIESGSPVLFRLELGRSAGSVHGNWLNHSIEFSKSANGKSWFALAGVDVEQSPGKYVLEVTAERESGQ